MSESNGHHTPAAAPPRDSGLAGGSVLALRAWEAALRRSSDHHVELARQAAERAEAYAAQCRAEAARLLIAARRRIEAGAAAQSADLHAAAAAVDDETTADTPFEPAVALHPFEAARRGPTYEEARTALERARQKEAGHDPFAADPAGTSEALRPGAHDAVASGRSRPTRQEVVDGQAWAVEPLLPEQTIDTPPVPPPPPVRKQRGKKRR